MSQQPLVSIVIPVYNMADFLPETLDSVLASDYNNFEIIVMDDGSKDASLSIAREYAGRGKRIRVFSQANAGVCKARNNAILEARGEYILPVDADNIITPDFLSTAVAAIHGKDEVKVVCPRADFFGARSGEWLLPPFSLAKIARKNIMDTCALYRRSDWERVGGYCEDIIAREDWEFWISILKDGGQVVKLPEICLHYRVREGSKRVSDRKLKHHVIDVLNRRHADFFERELGGPLRYQRSWSRLINRISRFFFPKTVVVAEEMPQAVKQFVAALPQSFEHGSDVIYQGRNTLKRFRVGGKTLIVKAYCLPHLFNRFVYRLFRATKAERSYEYGRRLVQMGIGTPKPVGYVNTGSWFLLGKCYSVSEESLCPYTYRHFAHQKFENTDDILRAIARTTAKLHEADWIHKDYSAGNILFRTLADGKVEIEIIDLNRMRFHSVDMEEGCKNFERLPATDAMYRTLADEYAQMRGFDADECYRLITQYASVCRKQ